MIERPSANCGRPLLSCISSRKKAWQLAELSASFCKTQGSHQKPPQKLRGLSGSFGELSQIKRKVAQSSMRLLYEFIVARNSSLLCVRSMRSCIVFMASIGFMSAIYLRRIHMRSSVVLSCSRSSRRVLDATRLTDGNIRLLLRLRSS